MSTKDFKKVYSVIIIVSFIFLIMTVALSLGLAFENLPKILTFMLEIILLSTFMQYRCMVKDFVLSSVSRLFITTTMVAEVLYLGLVSFAVCGTFLLYIR